MLKCAEKENPNIIGQVCLLAEANTQPSPSLSEQLQLIAKSGVSGDFRISETVLEVLQWGLLPHPNIEEHTWAIRNKGVYLVTGGAGGLGLKTAEVLATRSQGCEIILCGRSAFNDDIAQTLEHLMSRYDCQASYRAVDIASTTATQALVDDIVDSQGQLLSLIHI